MTNDELANALRRLLGELQVALYEFDETLERALAEEEVVAPPPVTQPQVIARYPGDGWLRGAVNGGRLMHVDGATRLNYPARWMGGYEPGYVSYEKIPAYYRTIRLTTRTRVSPNWQGHPVTNKWGTIWTAGQPRIVLALEGSGSSALYPSIRLQGVPMADIQAIRNLGQNVGTTPQPILRGEWFDWEVEVRQNTLDYFDGYVTWRVNDALVGAYGLSRFTFEHEDKSFPIAAWRPVWGGSGSVTAEEQWMEVSSILIEGVE